MSWKHIFLFAAVVCSQEYRFSERIVDIIHDFGNNYRVSSYGCNGEELRLFSKRLSTSGYCNKYITKPFLLSADSLAPRRHIFIVDLECDHSISFLIQANSHRLFTSPFIWILIYTKGSLDQWINRTFSPLSILVDSHVLLAKLHEDGNVYLWKIFKKHISKLYEVETLGLWTNETKNFVKSRKNLGIVLNSVLVVTNNDSLNHLSDTRNKHIDSSTKVCYAIITAVVSIFNITLNISISDSWGQKSNNSGWTGLIGGLLRKETDIGGSPFFLMKTRVDLIDYVACITTTNVKFVFRQPKLSYVYNVYTLPFDRNVWISIGGLVVLMTLSLYVLMKWERSKEHIFREHSENGYSENGSFESDEDSEYYPSDGSTDCAEFEKRVLKNIAVLFCFNERIYLIKSNDVVLDSSLLDSLFLTISAICQQGAVSQPKIISGRIASFFLFVSLMFIYVSYSANIVALLQTPSNNIRTVEDLLNSRIDAGIEDAVYNRYLFSIIKDPIKKTLYEKKLAPPGKNPNYATIENGVERLRKGLFAFHMETGAGYKIIGETFQEDEKCDLHEIDFLQTFDPWIAVQKNSTYKNLLKIGFHMVRENGMRQRENYLIFTRKPICSSKNSSFLSVGLLDCYLAAMILAGGIGASLLVFLIELCVYSQFKKRYTHYSE